jgi:DNA mismatch repair protein PMS2
MCENPACIIGFLCSVLACSLSRLLLTARALARRTFIFRQVILDLQTAVKELIENSLDAESTQIEVRLRNYGQTLIEVVDNGVGIREENYESVAVKHATSKLRDFDQLNNVASCSFGFRGEALSSLCALGSLRCVVCSL